MEEGEHAGGLCNHIGTEPCTDVEGHLGMLLEPKVRAGGRLGSQQPTGGAWSKKNRCEHPGKVQGERKPSNYQRARNRQEPESQELKSKEQGVRGGEWPPAITKDKEKQVSAGFGNKNDLSERGHWLRWQVRFPRWRGGNGSPCSEECVGGEAGGRHGQRAGFSHAGERDKDAAAGKCQQGCHGSAFMFSFSKDERDLSMFNAQ